MPKEKEDNPGQEPQTDAEKLAAAQKKLKEQEQQIENAQGLISKWGNEIGETRKKLEEIDTLKTSVAELKTLIESLKVDPNKPKGQEKEETLEEVEKNLTDSEMELARKKYKELCDDPDVSDADKAAYARDPKKRLAFLKEMKKTISPTPPDDFFADNPAKQKKTQDTADTVLANLFKTKKEQEEFTPPGSSGGGTVRAPGKKTQQPVERAPVQGGVLDELDTARAKK